METKSAADAASHQTKASPGGELLEDTSMKPEKFHQLIKDLQDSLMPASSNGNHHDDSSGNEDTDSDGLQQISEDHVGLSEDELNRRLSDHIATGSILEYGQKLNDDFDGRIRIRLLTLRPGDTGVPLEAELETVFLDEGPIFDALSYCWGVPYPKYTINVSGHKFEATMSLKLCLYQLRRKDAPRRLWIDAICINQYDDEEKSYQVSNMAKIYAKAQQTIVWLGEEYENSHLALEMCWRLFRSSVISFVQAEFGGEEPEASALLKELSLRTTGEFDFAQALHDYGAEVGRKLVSGEGYDGPYKQYFTQVFDEAMEEMRETEQTSDPDEGEGLFASQRDINASGERESAMKENHSGSISSSRHEEDEIEPKVEDFSNNDGKIEQIIRDHNMCEEDVGDQPEHGETKSGRERGGDDEISDKACSEESDNEAEDNTTSKSADTSESEEELTEDDDSSESEAGDSDESEEDDLDESEEDDSDQSEEDESDQSEATETQSDMEPTSDELMAFFALLERPWFRRVWIIQEVAVSADVVIQCGSSSMAWYIFLLGFTMTLKIRSVTRKAPFYHRNVELMSATRLSLQVVSNEVASDPELQLLPLLFRYRRYLATDPRDKVFALFGLTDTDLKKLNLVPDYSIDVRETYMSVAKALVSSSGSLDILSVPIGEKQSVHNLPSWVPRWDDSELDRLPFSSAHDYYGLRPSSDSLRSFSSSQDSSADATFLKNGGINLQGYVFDQVADVTRALSTDEKIAGQVVSWNASNTSITSGQAENTFTSIRYVFSYLRKFAEILEEWQNFGKIADSDRFEIFARTLWTDLDPENAGDACREWLSKWHNVKGTLDSLPLFEGEPTEENLSAWVISALPALLQLDPEQFKFQQNIPCVHILGRRLAQTCSDKLCLLPSNANVGDEVCLLRGSKTPHVVRRLGNGFQYVGEAFVHGAMYGEIWKEGYCYDMHLL